MLQSNFAEDILLQFCSQLINNNIVIEYQDVSPFNSFYQTVSNGTSLTKKQADFAIKLLEKYKNQASAIGFDYRDNLFNIQWRTEFRELDLSKKIYVEYEEDKLEICIKFPYQLKKLFEEDISNAQATGSRSSVWDSNKNVTRLDFYKFNLISLYEFAIKHNFEIDDSFMSAVAQVEEIWQGADDIVPYCFLGSAGLELANASADAAEYYLEHKKADLTHNLLLAKSMGFLYNGKPTGIMERIASSSANTFWIKDYSQLFEIYNQLKQRVCVILDRTSDRLKWLKEFVADADRMGVSRADIRVCFRDHKNSDTGINEWIKEQCVGGKVEDGKILIFEFKPAKWLFTDKESVKLLVTNNLVTNNLYPSTNTITEDWFSSHPCVIYLGDTKPTEQKGNKIVEL